MKHLLLNIQPATQKVCILQTSTRPSRGSGQQTVVCIYQWVHLSTNFFPSMDESIGRGTYFTESQAKQGPGLYFTQKGSLYLSSRKTWPQLDHSLAPSMWPQPTTDQKEIAWERWDMQSLVGKFGRTRSYPMPSSFLLFIWPQDIFAVYQKLTWMSSLHKGNSWAQFLWYHISCKIWQVTLISAYKVDLNNSFGCIGEQDEHTQVSWGL